MVVLSFRDATSSATAPLVPSPARTASSRSMPTQDRTSRLHCSGHAEAPGHQWRGGGDRARTCVKGGYEPNSEDEPNAGDGADTLTKLGAVVAD